MGVKWWGDLVVMWIGKRDPMRQVDMHGKDKRRVNYAVKKYVSCHRYSPNGLTVMASKVSGSGGPEYAE